MLFVILTCSINGMLLQFGLGLSDATQRDTKIEYISGEHQICPKSTTPPYTLDATK